MSEQTENSTTGNSGNGSESEADDLIGRADKTRQGLAEENKRMEKNIAELQKLKAREILGGQSEAGRAPEKKEIDPREYAKMALQGKFNK